jgi:hypothetical protein
MLKQATLAVTTDISAMFTLREQNSEVPKAKYLKTELFKKK